MADEKRVTEIWTYTGIRVGNGSKKVHAWVDQPGGEEMWFGKLNASVIGGQYEVQVERAADGKFQSVLLSSSFTGDQLKGDQLGVWQAKSRMAQVELDRMRLERKLKAEDDAFEQAMIPLRELYVASSRTWVDRSAFLAMVIANL